MHLDIKLLQCTTDAPYFKYIYEGIIRASFVKVVYMFKMKNINEIENQRLCSANQATVLTHSASYLQKHYMQTNVHLFDNANAEFRLLKINGDAKCSIIFKK